MKIAGRPAAMARAVLWTLPLLVVWAGGGWLLAQLRDVAQNDSYGGVGAVGAPTTLLVVAAVGNTVYCIGGANRPTHEGPVATVEALDFV